MPNLRLVLLADRSVPVIGPFSSLTDHALQDELSVVIDHSDSGSIDMLSKFCKLRHKYLSLYILPTCHEIDLCDLVKGNVRKVYICGDSSFNQKLTAKKKHRKLSISYAPLCRLCSRQFRPGS